MFKSAMVVGCAVFCAALTGMGILSFREDRGPVQAAAVQAISSESVPTSPSRTTAIPKASDGHFWANASVNNKAVRFLVDTGATQVVLTPADAQRLGFAAASLSYDRKVITANGPSYAAMVKLNTVGVGASTVRNVDALIVQDGLTTSLLGMSYLGRLSRFEATPSSLILHP